MRRTAQRVVVAFAVVGALGVAPAAGAAVIGYDAEVLIFTGGGETNDQVVGVRSEEAGKVLVVDPAEVTGYPERGTGTFGCYSDDPEYPHYLYCTFSAAAGVRFLGGEGDDHLSLIADVSIPVEMHGEGGADRLQALGQAHGTLDGGPGPDRLSGDRYASTAQRLLGGEGNDELSGGTGADELRGGCCLGPRSR